MDLPKRDSTLPEAASERDQCSPYHPHCLPCHSTSLLHHRYPDTTVPHDRTPFLRRVTDERPSVYASPTNNTGAPHTARIAHVPTQRPVIINATDLLPWRDAWTTSPLFHFQTISRTGQTYPVPDADPSDETEDIPTQPVPHFTRHID
jgi:hypothetical protein